jgi:hypothetical protein
MNRQALMGYGLALLLGAGGFASFVHQQRVIGAREVELRLTKLHSDSVTLALKAKTTQFIRDTIRIFRSTHTIDTLLEHRIDTAIVQHTDTVKLTVQEAQATRDTIRACRETLRNCADIQRDLRLLLRDDTVTIRVLRARIPTGVKQWAERAVLTYVGVQAGCLLANRQLCLTLRLP